MKDIDIEKFNNIHFIGIGGIGVSAIAKMMLLLGKKVSGSDLSESEITKELVLAGATISMGHRSENLPESTNLVVYTVIIPENNPEFSLAIERGIKILSYPEVLGLISAHKKTIAVSGTHGKTTTTAMIAKIFLDAGKDPTVVVGSKLLEQKSNFVAGKGEPASTRGDSSMRGGYFIVEACEYKHSFLNINPTIAVITNIDNDHLDYYKDIDDIISAFHEFADKVPKDGYIIADLSDKNTVKALGGIKAKIIDFSQLGGFASKLDLKAPGEHNRKNAAVALAVANVIGIPLKTTRLSLVAFSGTWRRFEYKGTMKNGALVYDDYAHHPTEIKETILGAREKFPDKKVTIIFQPHLYSRTKILFDDFVSALSMADKVIVTDIYAAREPNDFSINGKILADAISEKNKNILYISKFEDIVHEIKNSADSDDLIITMGAGDVYKIEEKLVGGI